MASIGINGFGRIGRITFRVLKQYHNGTISAVAANGSSDARTNSHLLKWDSVYGKYPGVVETSEDSMIVDGERVKFFSERDPAKIPWSQLGVDIVIDCTGTLRDAKQVVGHLNNGAKKVIISAPAIREDITIIPGVNEEQYNPMKHHILSAGSCTTNCIAPVVKILHQKFGITKGFITTIHAYTRDQRLLDRHHEDLRRARSAAINIVPTVTGAAKLVGRLIPGLDGKLDGMAIRVPVPAGSLVDFVANLECSVTASEVNDALHEASDGILKGILEYSEEELVSSDFIGTHASAVVDAPSTKVMGGNMIKVLAWYDNEWGYCCRLADLADYITQKGL
jgi:glyceraldehyde 3-phosphate dehydrogenase